MKEIWKDIKDYEGIYQVSNLGRVKNFKKRYIRKFRMDKDGYYQLNLCKNGIVKTFKAHRLVALAFINKPRELNIINHIDENKINNSIDNLEWCNRAYNNTYGSRYSRLTRAIYKKELKTEKILEKYESIIDASKKCGIDNTSISKCLSGSTKSAGGFLWARAEA